MYKKVNTHDRLSYAVANQIKQLIISEKLRPGDKLPNEMQLAELFGVSRPTVREAVKSLASQNIIEIARGRGTFVAQNPGVASDPLGLAFIADDNLPLSLIEMRLMIEPPVTRLAAQRAQTTDIEKLESIIAEMEKITNRDSAWLVAEIEFHRSISKATQNPVIMRIVPVIHDAIVKTLQYAPLTSADHHQAFIEHTRIVTTIRDKDQEAAFEAMRQHLENGYRRSLIRGLMAKGKG